MTHEEDFKRMVRARDERNRERFIWTAAAILWLAAMAIGWVK